MTIHYELQEVYEQYIGDKRRAHDESNVRRGWKTWYDTENWSDIEQWLAGKMEISRNEDGTEIEYHTVPDVYRILRIDTEVVAQQGSFVSPFDDRQAEYLAIMLAKDIA